MPACPRCEAPWDEGRAVVTSLFDGRPLGRCLRCGVRFTTGPSPHRRVRTCDACSLPFLSADEPAPALAEARCDDCLAGRTSGDLVDASVVSATEAEMRLAIDAQWRFVTSRPLASYLGAVLRRVAASIDGAAAGSRVVLVDEPALRSLTLPSGLVLISVGLLSSLEDEAELAFVLGHELAHAALGDAAARLVRLALHSVSREQAAGAPAQGVWARAATDLIRLGYGRRRERESDRVALGALVAAGYDPRSVIDHLDRLRRRSEAGDARYVEHVLAHPAPVERQRWIRADLGAAPPSPCAYRVNRELFRRVAGRAALAQSLVPRSSLGEETELLARDPTSDSVSRGFFWAGLGVMLLVAAIVLIVLVLSL